MKEYKNLVYDVMNNGVRKENTRGGIDTISVFGYNYTVNVKESFPLLTTKEVSWKNILIENLWFISGESDIKFLKYYDCKFWDPWADKNAIVPSPYGAFWRRSFNGIDQLKLALNNLDKNFNSRSAVITAWDPANTVKSSLPPCHMIQVLNAHEKDGRKYLNLHLTQRSCDIALGLPYNLAGYAFLLNLYARFLGMTPWQFNHTLVDAHIYTASKDGKNREFDHIPGLTEQIGRLEYELPKLVIDKSIKTLANVEKIIKQKPPIDELLDIFKIVGYRHHPAIKFKPAI